MANCQNCGYELPEGAVYCPKCGTSVPKAEEPVVAASAMPVARGPRIALWGERFVAWLIDVVIIGAVAWIIGNIAGLGGMNTLSDLFSGRSSWLWLFNISLTGVFQFLYWMFMEGLYGQSFGKRVMRLKVVRLDGSPANMGQSAIQSVGKAFILWLDVLLGWFLFNKKRQRVFNSLSGTIVVKAK